MSWRDVLSSDYQKKILEISSIFSSFKKTSSNGMLDVIDVIRQYSGDILIIGGIARSYYTSARNTSDIDLLFLNEENVQRFLKLMAGNYTRIPGRNHAVKVLSVEVELLTPEFLQLDSSISDFVFSTKVLTDLDLYVPSVEGFILLKCMRMSQTDEDDIRAVIQSHSSNIDFSKIYNLLSSERRSRLEDLVKENKGFFR